MRLVGILMAVAMIAACPPRRSRVVYVQPRIVYAAPAVVTAAPPVALAELPVAPLPHAVDPIGAVLTRWERAAAGISNLRTEISVKRTDIVFKKETAYTGTLLWMKPNFTVLRMENSGDPSKTDYEAYICNGQTLFAYNGVQKQITEIELVAWKSWSDQQPFDILNPLKATDMKERFDITAPKTDEHYVYLELRPRTAADKREFQLIRLALYGAGPTTEKLAYLPAQVQILKPGGDVELWKFSNLQVNIPGITEAKFQSVPVEGWKVNKSPRTPSPQP